MTSILLASNSARRRQLIHLTGWEVTYASADIDETRYPGEMARDYVTRMAREKSQAIHDRNQAENILSADTIVVDGETIYGKPADGADARSILMALRGHAHQVMTAITLIGCNGGKEIQDLCVSDVRIRSFTTGELEAYIQSGDPMDKAGAYAIQNQAFHPVEGFTGCFASVMGMPLCHLARMANKLGLTLDEDLAGKCQMALGYPCTIHEAVRRGDIIG
jgi:septum formation protein